MTKDGKDEIGEGVGHALEVFYICIEETPQDECVGQLFSFWSAALGVLAGVTEEYAASDDAQALASLCKRVKVKVYVTEKFSHGTHFVYANLGRMLKLAQRALSDGEGSDRQVRPHRFQREEIRFTAFP